MVWVNIINPTQDGPFWNCLWMGWEGGGMPPSLKSVTRPAKMKLGIVIPYLKKIQKICKSRDTLFEFCWHQHFFTGNQQLYYIKKYRYRLHFNSKFPYILTLFESSKVFLINMIKILMMSVKLASLGLLKIKIFWNKTYNVILSVHGVTNKTLSRDSIYIVDMVMRPKFGNSALIWEKLL